jgi:hypothetical protein
MKTTDNFASKLSTKCIGVFSTLDNAKDTVIHNALTNDLRYIDYYNPSRRFYLQSWREKEYVLRERWEDIWLQTHGISTYIIEVWRQNDEDGLVRNIYFNLDSYLKTYIADNTLFDKEIVAFFTKMKDNPQKFKMYDCFSEQEKLWRPSTKHVDRQKWLNKYGYVEPY